MKSDFLTNLLPKLYFSYSQFMVFDETEELPGCEWTEEHSAQGFARRESTVCFGTPLEFGNAEVRATIGSYRPRLEYDRVIAVPFFCSSGKVIVEGPEEMDAGRLLELPNGNYKLTAAQIITGDDEETIDLFFEPLSEPLDRSVILVSDEMLNPPRPLKEEAEIAGM
ncbi:MAG: hypothetical protein EOP09_03890 [Proteobacteria bacterium]|nr:MAG: hypothetical protein EOP09_03890 [Pseudomonadota bacterium]